MEGRSMRTTLDIDRDLLDRARAALGATTYTEAIERSLSQAVAGAELDAVLESVRGEDLVWSLDELQEHRRMGRGLPR
jgi:hypothetical protein